MTGRARASERGEPLLGELGLLAAAVLFEHTNGGFKDAGAGLDIFA